MTLGKSLIAAVLVLAGSGGQAAPAAPAEAPVAARTIDLARAFGTRSPWTFTTPQGPDIIDPIMDEPDAKVPGKLRLCISKDHGRTCSPVLDDALTVRGQPDTFSEAHYLNDARIEKVKRRSAMNQLRGRVSRSSLITYDVRVIELVRLTPWNPILIAGVTA